VLTEKHKALVCRGFIHASPNKRPRTQKFAHPGFNQQVISIQIDGRTSCKNCQQLAFSRWEAESRMRWLAWCSSSQSTASTPSPALLSAASTTYAHGIRRLDKDDGADWLSTSSQSTASTPSPALLSAASTTCVQYPGEGSRRTEMTLLVDDC